ncbi:putative quinol monooxygenase [Schlesneria sp. T3-172]|uniref:putative quinol monooxygenase n=1 Tax=Schlesneria TaxID=656899 RepID=UPI002F126EDB
MIHVLALVETIEGHREDFLREFAQVAVPVRQEAGCIEYGAAIDAITDVPQQFLQGENFVLIVEKWESLDHLKAHLVAPHMADYRVRVKPFVSSVRLQILDPRV